MKIFGMVAVGKLASGLRRKKCLGKKVSVRRRRSVVYIDWYDRNIGQ